MEFIAIFSIISTYIVCYTIFYHLKYNIKIKLLKNKPQKYNDYQNQIVQSIIYINENNINENNINNINDNDIENNDNTKKALQKLDKLVLSRSFDNLEADDLSPYLCDIIF
jgi:hypothetical protein